MRYAKPTTKWSFFIPIPGPGEAMKRNPTAYAALLALIVLLCGNAHADSVFLRGGEKLIGKVVSESLKTRLVIRLGPHHQPENRVRRRYARARRFSTHHLGRGGLLS